MDFSNIRAILDCREQFKCAILCRTPDRLWDLSMLERDNTLEQQMLAVQHVCEGFPVMSGSCSMITGRVAAVLSSLITQTANDTQSCPAARTTATHAHRRGKKVIFQLNKFMFSEIPTVF